MCAVLSILISHGFPKTIRALAYRPSSEAFENISSTCARVSWSTMISAGSSAGKFSTFLLFGCLICQDDLKVVHSQVDGMVDRAQLIRTRNNQP